jgi:hypothetical protein
VHGIACVVVAIGSSVSVGMAVGISSVGNGEANSTANVVGKGDGVGGRDGVEVSANESEIPPMTSKREIAPIINPLPIWRRVFMIISPHPNCSWRWVVTR